MRTAQVSKRTLSLSPFTPCTGLPAHSAAMIVKVLPVGSGLDGDPARALPSRSRSRSPAPHRLTFHLGPLPICPSRTAFDCFRDGFDAGCMPAPPANASTLSTSSPARDPGHLRVPTHTRSPLSSSCTSLAFSRSRRVSFDASPRVFSMCASAASPAFSRFSHSSAQQHAEPASPGWWRSKRVSCDRSGTFARPERRVKAASRADFWTRLCRTSLSQRRSTITSST